MSKVSSHIESNKLLNVAQYGFRKGGSCEQMLLDLQLTVVTGMESASHVDMVSFDLLKTFDSVDHRLLLYKMEAYGIEDTVLAWTAPFLSHRQ